MAWTKAKTAVVVGVVIFVAAGTTTAVIKRQPVKGPIPEQSWRFSKYATPEAAFQSSLWAMKQGDMTALQGSYTPEMQSQFMETVGKGKSDAELSALFQKIAMQIMDFQVLSNQAVSSDEVILHFRSARMGNASVPLKKVGNEWKMNGNIATDKPAGR